MHKVYRAGYQWPVAVSTHSIIKIVNLLDLIAICEKVSEELREAIIGNVEEGINLELAKKNLNFDVANAKKCNECWAYLKCRQCPAFSSCNLETLDKVKNQYCKNTRNSAEEELMDVSILQVLGCDYYVTEKKD